MHYGLYNQTEIISAPVQMNTVIEYECHHFKHEYPGKKNLSVKNNDVSNIYIKIVRKRVMNKYVRQ